MPTMNVVKYCYQNNKKTLELQKFSDYPSFIHTYLEHEVRETSKAYFD